MREETSIYLYNKGERFFGQGTCELLHAIEETGSLRSAAARLNLSYSKALSMIHGAEKMLRFPLTEKTIGGKGGGGSRLTPEAKQFVETYEAFQAACQEANRVLYQKFFQEAAEPENDGTTPSIGCVIMASGLSKRFGRNKLVEEFQGKTLIQRILDTTGDGMFARRVVVTRSEEVRQICEAQHVPVIFHELPGRNDTVRLGIDEMSGMDGCVFCPSDQPLLRKESLKRIVEAFSQKRSGMFRLSYGEKQGTPILFGKEYFEELAHLPEKKGGSYLAKKYPEQVELISAEDELELFDIDTTEDLERLKCS